MNFPARIDRKSHKQDAGKRSPAHRDVRAAMLAAPAEPKPPSSAPTFGTVRAGACP